MMGLKNVAGVFAVAGAVAFASLGMVSGVANAAPGDAQVPSVQSTTQSSDHATPPSPYAAYDSAGVCATPGLYFVNICV